jgi:uncharacterized membrane protein
VNAARLEMLERQVAALAAEVAELRGDAARRAALRGPPVRAGTAALAPGQGAFARATAAVGATISGEEIESLVGRYGTLLLAALVILMGVGVLIQVAVSRGMLTPAVRIGFGALAAIVVGGAGAYFHHKGEVRYGNVLLALSLAIVDLVAWGAGPRLHLIPMAAALAVVDLVAVALVALALRDESEFLFSVAVAGALSAPFVAADGGGTAPALLSYCACVVIGALRAVRQPGWQRAFALLVGGALLYGLAAAAMPVVQGWYAPYLIVLFGGACALGALLLATPEWRGSLSRAFLGVALLGLPIGWDRMSASPAMVTASVALVLAAVTYAALGVRWGRQELWVASALILPLVSLGVAASIVQTDHGRAAVVALWAAMALAAWLVERRRSEPVRGGAHLLAGGLLGVGVVGLLWWPHPLALVVGLAGWGVVLAFAASRESSPLPLVAMAVSLGSAALSAMDQLASRQAYAFVPFTTRSSASASAATVGLAAAAVILARGEGAGTRWAGRPLRLAVVIGYAILWGRMELGTAFTPDVSTFLLVAYYAACGVASIVVGRQLGIQRLRLAGLALAIYAAVKAVMEASEMTDLGLRVGAYGAVGVFLLGAGYLYRARKPVGAGDGGMAVS